MADEKTLTVIVLTGEHARVTRQFRVSRKALGALAVGLAVFMVAAVGLAVEYASIFDKAIENRELKDENRRLATRLMAVESRIGAIGESLERVDRFAAKLRAMTRLNDPARNLAMGPIGGPETEPGDAAAQPSSTQPTPRSELLSLQLSLHEKRLDALNVGALEKERNLRELEALLDDQKALLASTPAIWPVHGWVTSTFGNRGDPYTGKRTLHRGLDISNAIGTAVLAPADGKVIFAGLNSSYGKFVAIDHGYGVITRYGHLDSIKVSVGDEVQRGTALGALGNSGRSTGPHLHYEVEVQGVPVNPSNYILD